MSNRHILLPTASGAAAGQTAIFECAIGPTYERFDFELNVDVGGTPTDVAAENWGNYIDDIRVIVDSSTRIEITADDLVMLNQFYGLPVTDGVLALHLTSPYARTINGEDIGAYGTYSGVTSLNIEVDFKSGITINKFRGRYIAGKQKPFGTHRVIKRLTGNFSAVGEDDFQDVPKGQHNMLGLHINKADIGRLRVEANGYVQQDTEKVSRRHALALAGRFQQPDMTHVDFVGKNRIALTMSDGSVKAEAFPMGEQLINDFRVKMDFESIPLNYRILMDTIAAPNAF